MLWQLIWIIVILVSHKKKKKKKKKKILCNITLLCRLLSIEIKVPGIN